MPKKCARNINWSMTPSTEALPGGDEEVSRMGWVLCFAVGGGRRFRISNSIGAARCRMRYAARRFRSAPIRGGSGKFGGAPAASASLS